MLSAHPPDQVDATTNFTHHVNSPSRISSLETTDKQTISNMNRQQWQHQQYQSHQNDDTCSTPIFEKQPWQKAVGQRSLGKKTSSESLRSNMSTTSSIFSTVSKIKLPNVVKASVKGWVAKSTSTSRRLTLMSHNNNSNNPNSNASSSSASAYHSTSPPSSSFGHRLKKRSPSSLTLSSMFSRRRASVDQAAGVIGDMDQVRPQESISYSVLREESSCSEDPSPTTLHHRLSKLNLSSSSSPLSALHAPITSTTTIQNEYLPPITSPVGKLLFGEKVDTLFDYGSSSISDNNDHSGTQKYGCEREDNLVPQAEPILNATRNHHGQQQVSEQLPFHMFLVTATLTTLRTKLLADCDRILAASLQHPAPPFPVDDLKNIMQDLQRMSDLMGDQKHQNNKLNMLDERINKQATVREIISLMKQIIHDNVCQYYKVHEKAMIIPCKGYNIEGSNKFNTKLTPPKQLPDDSLSTTTPSTHIKSDSKPNESNLLVEHMDQQAHWFRTHFIQQSYSTFCGYDDEGEPILITTTYDSALQIYRAITRTKQGPDRRDTIQDTFLLNAPTSHQQRTATTLENAAIQQDHHRQDSLETPPPTTCDNMVLDSTWKAVIESSSAMPLVNIPFSNLKKISRDIMKSSGLEDNLLKLDESKIHTKYKFGILYVKEGQTNEEEWFTNEHDSVHLDHFLNIIGRRIPLLGYTGWAAGLDTKTSDSGEFTYTNNWQAHSIAYHVSTLIPSRQGDKQQIQRKKHIGNDIVCLVFVEGKQPFNPAAIKSQFLHVFIVVHKEEMEGLTAWKVEITTVENVPSFGPPLPEGGVFYDDSELQSFLLAKLINAEYAALKSPKFSQPLARAREGILTNIVERGYKLAQDLDVRTAHSKHSKSPSTSSERSSRNSKSHQQQQPDISPSPSRSSMIKDLSEDFVGVGHRKSTQDSTETRPKARQVRRKTKDISGAKQNQSEYEPFEQLESRQANLRTFKSNESLSHHSKQGSTKANTKKEGLRQRAQTIFTTLASKRHQQQESTNGSILLHPDL